MKLGWNEEIKRELGSYGQNVFIGHNVLFTNPKNVHLGNNVRIDPFTLITTALETGDNIQICSHSVLGGGGEHKITLGDWTFIGYGSKLFCASEDYSGDHGPVNEFWGSNKIFRGDIKLNNYAGIASDVMVMPGVEIPEGCTIGAKSFVYTKNDLTEWSIYLGNPLSFHKKRNKKRVIELSNNDGFKKDRGKKCAKVICCYFGGRRPHNNNNSGPEETLSYIDLMVENELKIDNFNDTDVILVVNQCGTSYLDSYLDKYNGMKTRNGHIIVDKRENTGLSFGAYFHTFLNRSHEYDYWFFCEDDVLIYKEGYIRDFISFYESSNNTIGFVSLAPITEYPKAHSGGGCGLASTDYFSKIYPDYTIKEKLKKLPVSYENEHDKVMELEVDFTNEFTSEGRILANHPSYSPLCENYDSIEIHKRFVNPETLSKKFIYKVGK